MHEWRPRLLALGILVVAAATGSLTVGVDRGSPLSFETPIVPYSPPRTPWGDPDLQGAYSNSDERGIPMTRPADLKGFRLGRFPPAELARLNRQRSLQLDPAANVWEQVYEPVQLRNSRPWLVSDPPDGQIPRPIGSRTQELAKSPVASTPDSSKPWESLDLQTRCVTRGLPGSMMPDILGNAYEIVQAPGVVAITYEAIHEARIVYLDGRPPVGRDLRTYLGDARGRFEGDTLVVETTNFTNRTPFHLSSESLRLVERFTPIAAATLQWSVTLDDSKTWPTPWTFAMNLTRTDGGPLEYACHEGNYSLRNILAVTADASGK